MAPLQARRTNSSSLPGSTMRQMVSSARSRLAKTITMAGKGALLSTMVTIPENPALDVRFDLAAPVGCQGFTFSQPPTRVLQYWKSISADDTNPAYFAGKPGGASRVRGRVLIVQEHQPLPAEPDVHLSAHPALQES